MSTVEILQYRIDNLRLERVALVAALRCIDERLEDLLRQVQELKKEV